eukprot:COSAG03_NODE_1521_length_3939_cov_8.358333_4_plen_161_part_00
MGRLDPRIPELTCSGEDSDSHLDYSLLAVAVLERDRLNARPLLGSIGPQRCIQGCLVATGSASQTAGQSLSKVSLGRSQIASKTPIFSMRKCGWIPVESGESECTVRKNREQPPRLDRGGRTAARTPTRRADARAAAAQHARSEGGRERETRRARARARA